MCSAVDITANLMVQHDQELVADVQPSALENKLP
jgi:hypothetical protein